MSGGRGLVILGTGGNCIDILDAVLELNDAAGERRWECLGFLDDDPARAGTLVHGLPVLGPLAHASALPADVLAVNGIGSPHSFRRKPDIIAATGLPPGRFATIVHPAASVSRFARLGEGTVVLQQATIASDAVVGRHVIVLPSSVISHDDLIGDYTCIAGGVNVSGNVTVGRCCYLGTGACLRGGVRVGDGALVGMGSVVLEDVPAATVVVGNPARRLREVPGVNARPETT